jgi:hypothetical protein
MIIDSLLLQSLVLFFKDEYYQTELVSVIEGTKGVSLRSIDWFITNYSKKNNTYYLIYKDQLDHPTLDEKDNTFHSNLNVHHSYKSQLKAYSKKRFDPFCRRDRILFEFGDGSRVETTIGQLNFFRWALQNSVVDYIVQNKEVIETDMNDCLRDIKNKGIKKKGTRKQREELSLSATRGLSRNNITVHLNFD